MLRKLALLIAAATIGLVAPTVATAPANADTAAHHVVDRSSCTKTSSGSCIRGGQFCPKSKYGQSGYDASGRRYVCKGDRNHPHWMKP